MAKDSDGRAIQIGKPISAKINGVETTGTAEKVQGNWVTISYNDPHTDEPRSAGVGAHRCWQE